MRESETKALLSHPKPMKSVSLSLSVSASASASVSVSPHPFPFQLGPLFSHSTRGPDSETIYPFGAGQDPLTQPVNRYGERRRENAS
jgi:hypothetical protein